MSATTDDSLGLIVTATFAGNIERYLGQGDLRRGLVALVLVPRSGRATPGGLADQGGGYMAPRLPLLARSGRHTAVLARTLGVFSPEQVLHVGTPPQAGAVRSGNQIVFYVRRAGLSQVTNFVTYATNSSNIETVSSGSRRRGVPKSGRIEGARRLQQLERVRHLRRLIERQLLHLHHSAPGDDDLRVAITRYSSARKSRRANMYPVSEPSRPAGWLPKAEFDAIFSRVPRLCVEVVIVTPERGVLLKLRDIPPNVGAWHIPGGTVLFGEPVVEAVKRVARYELGIDVEVEELLGYIEYPSHYENGLDSPVGLAFRSTPMAAASTSDAAPEGCEWFRRLPGGLYAEQREFLAARLGLSP